LIVVALFAGASTAAAQGYWVRSTGYYNPYPGTVGGTWSYSAYPPTVALQDPWGRAYQMPLQPKVLYYDTPFLTQQGWYRPTTITVMPESRSRYFAPPPQAAAPPPSFRYDGGPTNPVPEVTDAPAPKLIPRLETKPALPAVPDVPKLPDVPAAPGADAGPKLGPAPMDVPPMRKSPG